MILFGHKRRFDDHEVMDILDKVEAQVDIIEEDNHKF